jgi:hypothetical protein
VLTAVPHTCWILKCYLDELWLKESKLRRERLWSRKIIQIDQNITAETSLLQNYHVGAIARKTDIGPRAVFSHMMCVCCWPLMGKETICRRISPRWLTVSELPPYLHECLMFLLPKRFVRPVPAGICKTTLLQVWVGTQTNVRGSQPETRTTPRKTQHILTQDFNMFFAYKMHQIW